MTLTWLVEQCQCEVHAVGDQEGDAADLRGPLLHPLQQDPPPRYEGCQHPDHKAWNTEVGRFWSCTGLFN